MEKFFYTILVLRCKIEPMRKNNFFKQLSVALVLLVIAVMITSFVGCKSVPAVSQSSESG